MQHADYLREQIAKNTLESMGLWGNNGAPAGAKMDQIIQQALNGGKLFPCPQNRFDVAKLACGGWARMPCRIWVLPFDSGETLIAPGQSVTMRGQPQYDFFGELLVFASTIADFFTLDDIKVGTQSQLIAEGSQLATVYSEASQNNILNLDAAGPGRDLTLRVTNITGVSLRARASLFGVVKKDS